MSEYQLEIQQIVIYPRCRSYRQFIQNLMADRSICTSRGAGLFYYLFRIALINLKKPLLSSLQHTNFCLSHHRKLPGLLEE